MAAPESPHFRWPFARDPAGNVSVVEQDSAEHLWGQQYAVVITPLGWRLERPDFGWPWPEFTPIPTPTNELRAALEQFVPAADVDITEWGETLNLAARHIRVQQRVATQGTED